MSEKDTAIVNKCMDILLKNVGAYETEVFIFNIRNNPVDYTEWQRQYYDQLSPEELNEMIKKHSEQERYDFKKAAVI